jgi:hypothetical protein
VPYPGDAPQRPFAAAAGCSAPALLCSGGGASKRLVRCPVTRWSVANQETCSLFSHVPTRGRCPFPPHGVHNVGTSGKRASSWLSSTHCPAWAFFACRQFFPRHLLFLGVAPSIAIRRPIRAHVMTLPEDPHGGALDLDPRRPIQVRRELCIGPIGSIASAARRSILPPPLDRGGQRLGDPPWLAWCPGDL